MTESQGSLARRVRAASSGLLVTSRHQTAGRLPLPSLGTRGYGNVGAGQKDMLPATAFHTPAPSPSAGDKPPADQRPVRPCGTHAGGPPPRTAATSAEESPGTKQRDALEGPAGRR